MHAAKGYRQVPYYQGVPAAKRIPSRIVQIPRRRLYAGLLRSRRTPEFRTQINPGCDEIALSLYRDSVLV